MKEIRGTNLNHESNAQFLTKPMFWNFSRLPAIGFIELASNTLDVLDIVLAHS